MAFHKDFHYAITGNAVDFSKTDQAGAASLPVGQGLELQFMGSVGRVTITVDGLDLNDPTRERVIGPHVDPSDPEEGSGSTIEEFNHVPLKVELFAPGHTQPVATWQTEEGWSQDELLSFQHTIGGDTSPPGLWKCRATNRGHRSASVSLVVRHNFDRQPLRDTPLPRTLIDHAYQLILAALMPTAHILGNTVHYSFGAELIEYFGPSALAVLGPHHWTLPLQLEGTGALQDFTIDASSGRALLDAMLAEWQRRKDEYEEKLHEAQNLGTQGATVVYVMQQKLQKNDEWRRDFEERVHADFATIHAHVAFSNIHLEREIDFILGRADVNIVDVEKATAEIYIAFDPALERVATLVLTPAEITGGLLDVVEYLGFMPELNDLLADFLVPLIDGARSYLGRYLGEALAKLAGRDAVFMRLTADQETWRVAWTALPSEDRVHPRPVDDDVVVVGGVLTDGSGGTGEPPSRPPPAEIPPEFIVVAPAGSPVRHPMYTEQLDKIQHLVVVMMENRSFDHMLGYLGLPANSRYEGVRGRHTNPLAGRSHPVQLRPAREIVPNPITRIPYSPYHGIDHVENQVANGAMSGFAQDFDNRHPGFGEYVMTYYTGEQLTCYDQLAREHAVCDHWFAAFPGGTWPNRWITLSGITPELNNLEVDDSRIGFLEGMLIFDLLSQHHIPWRVYESDLSLIRTYRRYRLDTEHVVPFYNRYDATLGFEQTAKDGRLPAVSFVEPNFSDIPPPSTANDDLAPTDLLHGQDFIRRVVNAVRASTKWSSTLLLITYDEHGGFYDHVPPPGTELGPDEWKGRVPPLHPATDPPSNYMGVRVPAIIISPLVFPGSVCKQVFDHTSIIKTILLRYRRAFPSSAFTQFGPRVNIAADLGLALSQEPPPIEARAPIPRTAVSAQRRTRPAPATVPVRRHVDPNDFHESLRRAFLPRR